MHEQAKMSRAQGPDAKDYKTGQPTKAEQRTFLTGPQVQARYGRSHVTIWRWVRDAKLGFPHPTQINRLNYWRLSDLEAWEAVQEGRAA